MGKTIALLILAIAMFALACSDMASDSWGPNGAMAGVNWVDGNADVLVDDVIETVGVDSEYKITAQQIDEAKEMARQFLSTQKEYGIWEEVVSGR